MNGGGMVAGLVFIVLGILFLLDSLGTLDLRPSLLVPAALIAVGVAVVFTARRT
jgi:Domain of unknown function (DUF5668)